MGQIATQIANTQVQLTLVPQQDSVKNNSTENKVTNFARYAAKFESNSINKPNSQRDSKLSKMSDKMNNATAELQMSLQAKKKVLSKAGIKPEPQRRISDLPTPSMALGQQGVFTRERSDSPI